MANPEIRLTVTKKTELRCSSGCPSFFKKESGFACAWPEATPPYDLRQDEHKQCLPHKQCRAAFGRNQELALVDVVERKIPTLRDETNG